jgi:hypothetical protein
MLVNSGPSIGRVAFCSRGKGRGHAIPDFAISRELQRLQPGVEVIFLSYATGARTLESLGARVIDLGLPEDNPMWETITKIIDKVAALEPLILISHEEFYAVPICRALGLPTVFLTDWFGPLEHSITRGLAYADLIIFLDDPGYADVPPWVQDRIVYVGPVLGRLSAVTPSRDTCRAILGFCAGASVISVIPGGAEHHSEAKAPLCDLVMDAYQTLAISGKRLVWVASEQDYQFVRSRLCAIPGSVVFNAPIALEELMVASDVIITKGNRITALESEALGIPSISISFGLNPIDDQRISRIRSNIALRARGISPALLGQFLARVISQGHYIPPQPPEVVNHRAVDAAVHIQRVLLSALNNS